jgi:hypothetical protein
MDSQDVLRVGRRANDRFSTLDEINTEKRLRTQGDYVTKIGKEATAAKFSAEGVAPTWSMTSSAVDSRC